MDSADSTTVQAVSSILGIITPICIIISAVATATAATFAANQVRLMKRAREVDAFLRLIAAGNEYPVRSASDWVKYKMPNNLSYEQARADSNIWDRISTVIHHFEVIGVLVSNHYIPVNLVYDQMGPWIVGTWAKLEPLAQSHRMKRKAPGYAENFEMLATGYQAWAKSNPPKLEKRARSTREAAEQYYR